MATLSDISRRSALGLLGAGAAGFALFGPRGRSAPPKGRLVLDYWEKWTGLEGKAMGEVVDAFNASQDRLFVRYLITGTIHQKALISIAGGVSPDIIGLNSFTVPTYAESGAILPLDDLAAKAGLRMNDYAAGMRRVMQHNGRWWATINTGGTLALYYNKGLFAECEAELRQRGLDASRAPRTIEEWELASEAITKTKQDGTIERAGHLHIEPGWWSWIWGYSFGGTIFDEDRQLALAGSAENLAAYAWLERTSAGRVEHVKRFTEGFGPYGTARSAFLTGQVAMVVQGPWLANQIKEHRPNLDYGVAPVPTAAAVYDPAAPIACIDTDVLMIPAGAKHPEASMEFIAFTQRQDNVEKLALAHCKGSPMVKASDSFVAQHPNRGVRLHTQLADSPRAFFAPRTPVWAEMKDPFDTAVLSMWRQQLQSGPTLAGLQRGAQAMIDRNNKLKQRRGEPTAGPTSGPAAGPAAAGATS